MIGAIIGGGVGAFSGGATDVLIANTYLNRETHFDELIRHATEEGALSVVGDVAIAGIAKYGGKALAKAQDLPLGKIIDYTPILGFAKRAVDGNASSAQKLIDKTYTQEQMLSLKEAGESFGATLSFKGQKGKNPFKSTFGEDSSFAKSYDFLQNALSLPTQRARQQEFIQAIRADESGQLLAFLSEASAQSPKAYDNMRSILNATSFQVKKQLDNLNLNKGDIKAVFDELESGTKQSYDEAINKIIGGIYNDSYKVNLNELKSLSKEIDKPIQQEQKGIYNVTYNGKNATLIKQDLESVENAISFMQGTRYKGAKHERIKHLTDPSKAGYITDLELVNLGKDIREYLAKHKEPFIDTNGARLYEWEKDSVRFRAVVNDVADMDSNPTTATQEIITFYSDRNLKDKMQFKNPKLENVKEHYTPNNQTFKVQPHEVDDFQKHFNFKNKKLLLRELRENEIAHALKSHGDEIKETQRGNIAITRADIEANYPRITQKYDELFFTNRSVIYVKQVNGYHIGIEEALLGQDKLIFKSLWKTKGNYNREVLLKNAKANPYPHNADEVAKSESISNPSLEQGYPQQYHLSTIDSTTNKVFNQGDIKFDSLGDFEYFARLSGFENIPQEKLQSAHTYILENLNRLEC